MPRTNGHLPEADAGVLRWRDLGDAVGTVSAVLEAEARRPTGETIEVACVSMLAVLRIRFDTLSKEQSLQETAMTCILRALSELFDGANRAADRFCRVRTTTALRRLQGQVGELLEELREFEVLLADLHWRH